MTTAEQYAKKLMLLKLSMDRLKSSLVVIQSDLDRKTLEWEQTNAEYAKVLEQRALLTVQEHINNLVYKTVDSGPIYVNNPSRNFEFKVSSEKYDIGTTEVGMDVFLRAKVCDLSTYLEDVFCAEGDNILQKVMNFMKDKWENVRTYDFYTLAVDKKAQQAGRKKCDLPNVNFAFVMLFLKTFKDHDLVVSDPRFRGTDATVKVTNFSHVYRELLKKNKKIKTPMVANRMRKAQDSDNLDILIYQRGTGNPDKNAYVAMEETAGISSSDVMHMYLVPGKESVGLMGGNCYDDYAKSASKILHELEFLDKYCALMDKKYINNVYFVLDPFSAYAAFTAVAILAYGLEDMYTILAGRYVDKKLVYTAYP